MRILIRLAIAAGAAIAGALVYPKAKEVATKPRYPETRMSMLKRKR